MIRAAPTGVKASPVMQILPPVIDFAVRRRPASASESGLARADAAAFMVGDADPVAALAKLPHAALWQALYAATWLFACGLYAAGLALGAFAAVGFLAMTVLKEILGSSGRPLEWRG